MQSGRSAPTTWVPTPLRTSSSRTRCVPPSVRLGPPAARTPAPLALFAAGSLPLRRARRHRSRSRPRSRGGGRLDHEYRPGRELDPRSQHREQHRQRAGPALSRPPARPGYSSSPRTLFADSTFGLLARLVPTATFEPGDAGRPRLAARGARRRRARSHRSPIGRRAAPTGGPLAFA
jgi:hypothetical protein